MKEGHRTMNVILARQRIGRSFGGAEGYVAMLARAMRAMGARVTLMAQRVDKEMREDGFDVLRAARRPTNLWGSWSFAKSVRTMMTRDPDARVLAFDRIPGVQFIRAGDGSHKTYIESMGGRVSTRISPKHLLLLAQERKTYRHERLVRIFANSQMVADDLRRDYGIAKDKIRVVPTGIEPATGSDADRASARAIHRLDDDIRVILFAGHNFERKGLNTLLWALSLHESRSPEKGRWRVWVAGRDKTDKYHAMASGLGISHYVRFLGSCDLGPLFAAADLFVLPTRYDPMARVCLEAARAGLPVITTRKNGFCEWIDKSDAFVLDRPDDAEALAGMMQRALRVNLIETGRRLQVRTAHLTIDQNARIFLTEMAK